MVNESWEFDQIEFSTPDDDDLTVEKMFLQQHDPNLLYMSMEELKEFLDTKDGLDDKVDARLRLELFQMGIQYVEAFFMYFSAQLKGNANVVKDLITTRPGDVRQMCQFIRSNCVNIYLQSEEIDTTYEDRLRRIFGYDIKFEKFQDITSNELSEKEFEQKAAESVYVIQNQLKHIAYFYEGFADLYNAIKHGDRATPFGYAELRRVPDTEEDDEAKEPVATSYQYVLFLCRRHMQQGVYLTNAPIEYLMDVMWPAVDVTHQLFAHLRKVMIADLRGDSDKIPFYAVTTFKRSKKLKENSSRWIVMQNNETKQVLKQPEDGITKEMLVSQGAGKGVIAGRFARDSGQLAIRVNPEAKVCQDYPLEITLTDKGMVGLTMRRQADYKIEIRFEEMDLTQYRILQDLDEESNDGRIDSVTLINDSTNQEIKTKTQVPFHLPEIPDFLDDDLLEFLEGKQRALTQSIPVPVIRLSQAQRELMTEYRSKTSIEQEDIEEMFEKLEELGQKRKFTEIIVEKVMPSGRVLRSQSVGEVPWQINTPAEMGWIDEDEMNIPEEGDYHIRKVVSDYPYSDQELVALLENPDNNTLDIVTNILDRDGDLFSPNYADLAIEYRYGEDRFWHSKHTLWLKRRHLVECPLCEDIVDDSLEQHLSDDCTPDIIV